MIGFIVGKGEKADYQLFLFLCPRIERSGAYSLPLSLCLSVHPSVRLCLHKLNPFPNDEF